MHGLIFEVYKLEIELNTNTNRKLRHKNTNETWKQQDCKKILRIKNP